MPNGTTGAVWFTKKQALELLASLSGDTVVGEVVQWHSGSQGEWTAVSAAHLTRWLGAFDRVVLPISVQEDRCFLIHLDERDIRRWVMVQRGSPLFEPFARAPSGFRKHLVQLVSAPDDREFTRRVHGEMVEPLTRLSLHCSQVDIAEVTGSDPLSMGLAHSVSVVMLVGPSWRAKPSVAPLAAAQLETARRKSVRALCVFATSRERSEFERLGSIAAIPQVTPGHRGWERQLGAILKGHVIDAESEWRRERAIGEADR